MMRGGQEQQQQRKRRLDDDDDDRGAPYNHYPRGRRDDDRAERLERERRERMARLRADDGEGDGGSMTVPSTSATLSSGDYNKNSGGSGIVVGGAGGRGLGRGKMTNNTYDIGATGMKYYHDKNTDGYDDVNKDAIEDADEEEGGEEEQIRMMLGFGGFGTTKGKVVADNQHSAARGAASKNKGRKYRQYMNRKGGFNRPLDKMN
jgi:U4/U6.U5 tri-snRNP-associated protein 3